MAEQIGLGALTDTMKRGENLLDRIRVGNSIRLWSTPSSQRIYSWKKLKASQTINFT